MSGGPLNDRVQPPYGIFPGEPIRRLHEEQSAETEAYEPWEGEDLEYSTRVGSYTWYSESDDPGSVVSSVAVHETGCD